MSKPFFCFLLLCVFLLPITIVSAEETATPLEVVEQVESAALYLEETGNSDLAEFNLPESRWVWDDTYVFILDCSQLTVAAHPISPKLIGQDLTDLRDVHGKAFFKQLCEVGKQGGWIDYFWPKPGEKKASRKISYVKPVPGSHLSAGAGLYEELLKVDELEEFTLEMLQAAD